MSSKSPLDSFYKDSLRFGNLKVQQRGLKGQHACNLKPLCRRSASPDHVCIACLQCFSHFSLYLKGREELVVTVYHGDPWQYKTPPLARITLAG